MDKFDQKIKESQRKIEPSGSFVDATMTKISVVSIHKKHSFKLWLPVLAGSLAAVALLFVLIPNSTNQTTGKITSSSPASTQLPSGTSNSQLASDLSSVNSSINQESSDLNSANSALNDYQHEITVPTN
jgi:hypothetical protein